MKPMHLLWVLFSAFLLLPPKTSSGENRTQLGLMVGDPTAVTLRLPISGKAFWNTKVGIWAWHFWEDPVLYDTPYFSHDLAWAFPGSGLIQFLYFGVGLGVFFKDNPKDSYDSDYAVALRIPIGVQFWTFKRFSLIFELAPIHQFKPWYIAGPYGIELNGGLALHYCF